MAKTGTGTKNTIKGKKDSLTPLMQQYHQIKKRYSELILFFRLGDFYEMFGEDAKKAAPIMEVALTKRQNYPMCGVPYHSVNTYLKKLVKAGQKVAVCEQLEEPRQGAGIVKRDVVRVITPGTILEDNLLEAKQNNYLAAVYPDEKLESFGVAFVDISTGEFEVTQINKAKLSQEIFRLAPRELIVPDSYKNNALLSVIAQKTETSIGSIEDWLFSQAEAQSKILEFFKVQSLKPFSLENKNLALSAAGAILAYLEQTQCTQLPSLSGIRYYSLEDYMLLDENAVRNLELIEGLTTQSKQNSLLEIIDLTLTPMGARTLRQWLLKPLLDSEAIKHRQLAVEFFVEEGIARRQVRSCLNGVSDMERILSRLSTGAAGPREVIALKLSLDKIPQIKQSIQQDNAILSPCKQIKSIFDNLEIPYEVTDLITNAISDEPPISLKNGGVIKPNYNKELEELRSIRRDGKNLISEMESKERQRTGINILKIGYTSVFGYYIEVTKSNLKLVPDEYIRKQTLTNCERFITPELKILEEKILSSEEKILKLEEALFNEVRAEILKFSNTLKTLASNIALLDVFGSIAETAVLYNYCKPIINESYEFDVKDGRHPVIERKLKSGSFVPNDTFLNSNSDHIILLTGPNMAGKSTYLRQVALISVLAQMGSFVPAAEATIGIIDKIFTRIGAADNLAGGESTFMVEMHETSNILHQYTDRSLIILDEVGRGTSTYDGISIAWATVEHLAKKKTESGNGPKVLFATHYFELTDLQDKLPGVKNYNVSVKEWQDHVVFLHKIVPGSADRSYGIHVAQLAGLPSSVVKRAQSILSFLEKKASSGTFKDNAGQLDLFSAPPNNLEEDTVPFSQFLIELENIDLNSITPLEALGLLLKWKNEIKEKS